MVTVINGEGLLLGRMASICAKRALNGETIAVVNAEKAVISGSRARVFAKYDWKRFIGSREGGPFFPRRPDHLVKRTIRGMLPYKNARGADAMKRIKIYVGVPADLASQEMEVLEEAHYDRLNNPKYVTIATLSTKLGAKF